MEVAIKVAVVGVCYTGGFPFCSSLSLGPVDHTAMLETMVDQCLLPLCKIWDPTAGVRAKE